MSDRYEVVLLVDSSGAVKAFAAISSAAEKAADELKATGEAGDAGLKKTSAAAGPAAAGLARVSTAASALQRAAAGVAASSLVGFLADAARASAEADAIQARLQTSVDATGKSYDAYAGALDNAIQKSMALAFDDDDTAAALATLTQQTGDAAQAITLLGTAQDLARGKGIALGDAAQIVGKVAAGNVSILSRYGIVLDANASSTEALTAINQKFAGQSEAFANTTAGSLGRAQTAWGNFVEEIGGAAGPMQTIIGLLPGVTSGFQATAGAVSTATASFNKGGIAAKALGAAMSPLGLAIGGVTAAAGAALFVWEKWSSDAAEVAQSVKAATAAINEAAGANVQLSDAAKALLVSQTSLGDEAAKDAQHFLDASYNVNKYILSAKQADDINAAVADSFARVGAASQASLVAAVGKAEDLFRTEQITNDQLIGMVQGIDAAFAEAGTSRGADQLIAEITRVNQLFADGKTDPETYFKVISHLTDNVPAQIAMFDQLDQKLHDQAQALQLATDKYGPFIAAQKAYNDLVTEAVRSSAAQNFVAPGLSSLYQSPSQKANNDAALEQASADAIAKANQAKASAITDAVALIGRAYDDEAQAAKDASAQEIAAINDAYDAKQRQIDRQGAQATNAAQAAGREQVRQAQVASRGQVREAELAQTRQTNAARAAADAQIAAAKDAADQQMQAAKAAADAQVAAAEQAERAQARSAQVAANEQIRAANAAAHDQVAQAQKAAREQEAAAARLVTQVTAAAKAQSDATIQAAQAAHDQAVAQANKTADAEIAAAKRSADQQLLQLQRRTQAQQSAARDQANKAIEQANDRAARAIRGGADPGKVAKDLANAQENAYADQEKAQQNAANREQRQQDAIQAREQQKIDAINAYKEQATQAAADRLQAIQAQAQQEEQARVAAATKQAEAMKKAAAQRVAQVERATTQQTNAVERAANQSVEQAKREAARNTAAVKEQAAAQEAAAEQAIQANLQATTDAANRQAEKVATEMARNTARVRADAARTVKDAEQETAQTVKRLARDTAREQKAALRDRDQAVQQAKDNAIAAEKAIQDEAKRTTDAIILGKANADPAIASLLQAQGVIDKGASGKWEVILDDPTKQAIAKLDQYFGPNAVSLDASGRIAVAGDFSQFNDQIAAIAGKTVASVDVVVRPTNALRGTDRPAAQPPATLPANPSGPHALGGLVRYQLGGVIPAANGRVVRVGEAGPEDAILPAGTLIRPAPATAAASALGSGGVTLVINGDVYGLDDFEGKVQRAAADALSRGLPGAVANRRRALGA